MGRQTSILIGRACEGVYSSGEVAHVLDCSSAMAAQWMDGQQTGVFRLGTSNRPGARRITREALLAYIEAIPYAWERERRHRKLAEVHEHREQYRKPKAGGAA